MSAGGFDHIIGEERRFLEVLSVVKKAAMTDSTVLVEGEFGTGKRLIAEAIHRNSSRRSNAFVHVDFATFSKDLEFVGSVSGGTIFVEEIGKVELSAQAKLLEFLESEKSDEGIRFICSTSQDLNQLVAEKLFREDLYYRVNVLSISLPPLRERKSDIPALAEYFCNRFAREFDKEPCAISTKAEEKLLAYHWPSNINELRNVIERSVMLVSGSTIGDENFPKAINEPNAALPELVRDKPTMEELQKRYILETMREMDGNRVMAGDRLGMSSTTLWRKLKEYGSSQ